MPVASLPPRPEGRHCLARGAAAQPTRGQRGLSRSAATQPDTTSGGWIDTQRGGRDPTSGGAQTGCAACELQIGGAVCRGPAQQSEGRRDPTSSGWIGA